MQLHRLLASAAFTPMSLCSMASTPPGEEAPAGGGGMTIARDGGTLRATASPQEAADAAAKANAPAGTNTTGEETPKPAEGDTPPAEPKPGEEAPKPEDAPKEGEKPAPFDFKGTVFEGLSEDMQGKIAPFAATFQENGTLNDAEVKEAANATGFSESMVRQFMRGATIQPSDVSPEEVAAVRDFYSAAGGEDKYAEFRTWTANAENLDPALATRVNAAMGIGADGKPLEGVKADYEKAMLLLQEPLSRWKADGTANPPRDLTGGQGSRSTQPGQAGDTYGSWAEVQKDMGDARYRNDKAFNDAVQAKIGRSPGL